MKIKTLVALILLSKFSYSSELLHAFPILKDGETLLKSGIFLMEEKRLYQKDGVTLDSVSTDGVGGVFGAQKNFFKDHIFGIEVEYLFTGDYKEEYSGELENLSDVEVGAKGFREPLLYYRYWFEHNISPSFHHSIYLSYRPKIVTPNTETYAKGRTEGSFQYHYNYRYDNGFTVSGRVFTNIFSKAEIKNVNGLEDTVGSYTEAGFDLRPGVVYDKFSFHGLAGYTSTTDYNSRNESFDRLSDKGFSWFFGVDFKYLLSKNQSLNFVYRTKDLLFNSIEEDPTRDVEYELEERHFSITWWMQI